MRTVIKITALWSALVFAVPVTAQTVSIRSEDCTHLVRHVATSDVAFVPGVDLQGRFVVSADLGGSVRIQTPTEFNIPITVDLQRKLGIPVDPNQFQTQNFSVGSVTWKDGKGYFNGQPLQNDESERLAALCQKQMSPWRP